MGVLMVRVNLLPPERRPVKNRIKLIALFLGLTLLLADVSSYWYNYYRRQKVEQQITAEENRLQLLYPAYERLREADGKQKQIASRQQILLTLTRERKSWYGILAELSLIIPPQVRLTEIGTGDGGWLFMRGTTDNLAGLTDFMDKIEQSELLAEPELKKSEWNPEAAVLVFELTTKIRGI